MVKLDNVDIEIIRKLWDGRASFSDISEEINISSKTIGKRVSDMLENNAAEITCLVDPFKLNDHSAAFIGFKVEPQKRKECLEIIDSLKGVVLASIVTGRFDIMAITIFNKSFSYESFVSNEIPKVPNVIDIESFFAFGSQNFQLRYVLD